LCIGAIKAAAIGNYNRTGAQADLCGPKASSALVVAA